MPVYADSVFAINSLSNALLLYSYSFFYGITPRHSRLIGAAALGGLFASAEAILDLPHILRVGVLILLTVIAFGRGGLARRVSQLMLMCFAAEGITIAAVSMMGAYAELAPDGIVLFASEPVCAAIFIAAYPTYYLVLKLIKAQNRYIRLSIRYRGREVRLTVLRDSGNLLRYHDRPVIMVAWEAVAALFDHNSYKELRSSTEAFAIYRTISGAGTVPIIDGAECITDGIISNAALAVVERKFKGKYCGVAGDIQTGRI